jgi:hypothetical protein
MATPSSATSANLPSPCVECRNLVQRVAAAAGPWQQDEIVGAHPHARPDDPRLADYLRCAVYGCCWHVRFDLWEVAAITAEQLPEAKFRRQLRSIRYGLPFTEGRWGMVVLLYAPLLLASGGLAVAGAWVAAREPDGGARYWPVVVVFLAVALASGWGLVRAVRRCTGPGRGG